LGSWILYRPAEFQRQVRVRYLHSTEHTIVAVRAFDAETGAYLRDFALAEDDNNMGPVVAAESHPTGRANGRPNEDRGNSPNEDRGNSGNAPGRAGTSRDKGVNANNNGVAVGRADTSTVKSVPEPNTNAGRRTPRETIGMAVQQADSTSHGNTARPNSDNAVRRRDSTAVVETGTSSGGIRPEEPNAEVTKVRGNGRNERSEPEESMPGYDVPGSLGINARYLPDPGQCRIWIPGLPFGRQARPTSCNGIADEAPAGAWILRRSTAQPDVIRVDFIDDETAGVIVRAGSYEAATGQAVRSAPGARR